MVYRFIQNNCEVFGVRWLLRKYNLTPNAYYNFLKDRKSVSRTQKRIICEEIQEIYHHHYHSDEELNEAVDNFAYTWYNHVRPHTFNGGLTPFEARNRI